MAEDSKEGNNFDLTARGLSVTITSLADGTPIVIGDFPDDLDPITIDETDFAEARMDANGEWFRQLKMAPVSIHISVIPGSNAEAEMNKLLKYAMVGGSNDKYNVCANYATENAKAKTFKDLTFKDGWMTGCSLGYSATSQGRVRTKQYTFKFPFKAPQ